MRKKVIIVEKARGDIGIAAIKCLIDMEQKKIEVLKIYLTYKTNEFEEFVGCDNEVAICYNTKEKFAELDIFTKIIALEKINNLERTAAATKYKIEINKELDSILENNFLNLKIFEKMLKNKKEQEKIYKMAGFELWT